MARFTRSDDLRAAEFVEADLRQARFVESDLSGAVMRGVAVQGAEVEDPWLFDGGSFRVNGVDVVPFVDAELNRRFPGRAERHAADPEGLRAAWQKLEAAWAATLERAAAMPAGTVDASVDGEWSLAQTLRHLVLATDMWLGRAILQVQAPFHPMGQVDTGTAQGGFDVSVVDPASPAYADVLDVRAERVAMVRDYLDSMGAETLGESRPNPHQPKVQETVLSCLHTILDEEWEHLRYAVRDLDALEAGRTAGESR